MGSLLHQIQGTNKLNRPSSLSFPSVCLCVFGLLFFLLFILPPPLPSSPYGGVPPLGSLIHRANFSHDAFNAGSTNLFARSKVRSGCNTQSTESEITSPDAPTGSVKNFLPSCWAVRMDSFAAKAPERGPSWYRTTMGVPI